MMTIEKPYGRQTFEALIDCDPDEDGALVDDRLTIDDSGVYLNRFTKQERQGLTDNEVESIARHPTGRYDDPVLSFPFGLAELLEFERFYMVIADRRRYLDGERCYVRLEGQAIWLLDALLDVAEGKRTANEVNTQPHAAPAPQADTEPAPVVEAPASEPGNTAETNWVSRATERGWAIIAESSGRWFPTQKKIAAQIEREFSEAKPRVMNMHGLPLETSTIERELKRQGVSCKEARAKANLNTRGN